MIAVTKFKDSDSEWAGLRLPEERWGRWWEGVPVRDADKCARGTFPRDLVELP